MGECKFTKVIRILEKKSRKKIVKFLFQMIDFNLEPSDIETF